MSHDNAVITWHVTATVIGTTNCVGLYNILYHLHLLLSESSCCTRSIPMRSIQVAGGITNYISALQTGISAPSNGKWLHINRCHFVCVWLSTIRSHLTSMQQCLHVGNWILPLVEEWHTFAAAKIHFHSAFCYPYQLYIQREPFRHRTHICHHYQLQKYAQIYIISTWDAQT